MSQRTIVASVALTALIAYGVTIWFNLRPTEEDDIAIVHACADMVAEGLPKIAESRTKRFLGKVSEAMARCRGGERAVAARATPWVDWSNYWGTGDITSKSDRFRPSSHIFNRAIRGVDGALLDIDYQRMELINYNLFDNRTYEEYSTHPAGPTQKTWLGLRLPKEDPNYAALKVAADGSQLCQGNLIRFRTINGICNDIRNPAMGSTGEIFARNIAFEAAYPELALNQLTRNRHGDRIGLLKPDPQVISRRLFTRDQTNAPDCNQGRPYSRDADCSYRKLHF
jgi:hypothetical protein